MKGGKSPTNVMTPLSPSTAGAGGELATRALHRERQLARISDLERAAAHATSAVRRNQALVELAQLREQVDAGRNSDVARKTQTSIDRDLADIKDHGVATRLKTKLEYAVLKAKEDKVKYELDIQTQLLELRDGAANAKDAARRQRRKATDRLDEAGQAELEREEDVARAKEALRLAERALDEAQATKQKRGKELEAAIRSEEYHIKDLQRLVEETAKNDKVIRDKLRKAGLSQKEMDVMYDHNDVLGRAASVPVDRDKEEEEPRRKTGAKKSHRNNSATPARTAVPPAATAAVNQSNREGEDHGPVAPAVPHLDDFLATLARHRSAQERQLEGLQSEVERLNDKCSKAEWTELLGLRQTAAALDEEVGRAKKRVEELEDGKLGLENTVAYLNLRLGSLEGTVQTMYEEGEAKQTTIDGLERQNTRRGEIIIQLEADKASLQTTVSGLEAEGQSKDEKIEELERVTARRGDMILALEDDKKGLQNTVAYLNLCGGNIEEKIGALHAEGETKDEKIHALERNVKSQEDTILALEKEKTSLQNTLRALSEKVGEKTSSLEEEIKEVYAELETKQARIDELECDKLALENDKLSLENTTSELNLRYNGLADKVEEKITSLEEQIHGLTEDKEGKEERIQQLEVLNERYHSLAEKFREKTVSLQEEVTALSADGERKQEKMRELERDNGGLMDQIFALRNKERSLENKTSLLTLQFHTLAEKVEEKIDSLDSGLGEVKETLLYCQRQTSMMCSDLGEVQQQRAQHLTNVHRLRRRVEAEDQQLRKAKEVVKSLEEMKVSLEYRLMIAERAETRARLEQIIQETVTLLTEKERVSGAIEVVKASYERAIEEEDKLEILFLGEVLERTRDMLKGTEKELAVTTGIPLQKKVAPRKGEERSPLPSRPALAFEGMERPATPVQPQPIDLEKVEEIAELQRKLAEITLEKEELKKRVRPQKYQLSCRDQNCTAGIQYIGKTRINLVTHVLHHFEEIWAMVQRGVNDDDSKVESHLTDDTEFEASEFTKSSFAKHMAKHCRHARSKEEVLKICQKYVKVERPTRKKKGIAGLLHLPSYI